MRNALVFLAAVLLISIAFQAGKVEAQNGAVIYMQATAGTTLANCGTPNVPSLCISAAGVSIWQNSTDGWFTPQKSGGAAGVTSLSVNGGNAQTGAVAITIPSTAVIPAQNAPLK